MHPPKPPYQDFGELPSKLFIIDKVGKKITPIPYIRAGLENIRLKRILSAGIIILLIILYKITKLKKPVNRLKNVVN